VVIMLLYSVSYLSLPLMAIVDKQRKLSEWLYLSGVLVLWMSSSINWIFYGLLNRRFKRAYLLLFNRIRHGACSGDKRNRRIASSTSASIPRSGEMVPSVNLLENAPVHDVSVITVASKQSEEISPILSHPVSQSSNPVPQSSQFPPHSSLFISQSSHPIPQSSQFAPHSSHPIPQLSHPAPQSSHHVPQSS
ncbi:unnamed protein product, partial [Owenia fusiformis]